MRISGGNSEELSANALYNQIQYLKGLFKDIILVNPMDKRVLSVNKYGLETKGNLCSSICPLVNDKCGCICKDCISTGENRIRFIYNNSEANLVISTPVKVKYNEYVLILVMKLNPAFQFGAHSDAEAIDSITKLSSNLVIDPLTQIFNRKYLMDNIDFMIKESLIQSKHLCLACIDVDNFKRFNDSYGHDFGDLVLKKIADLMVQSTSVLKEAYNIRIGGDEFVIVALGIDKQKFKAIMNKLCLMVDDAKLFYEKQPVGIKISIGVSELISDRASTYKELYDKADTQLYKAKEAGKGCVR